MTKSVVDQVKCGSVAARLAEAEARPYADIWGRDLFL